jgi:hypothetical protein
MNNKAKEKFIKKYGYIAYECLKESRMNDFSPKWVSYVINWSRATVIITRFIPEFMSKPIKRKIFKGVNRTTIWRWRKKIWE